jgi:hypothetical protein
VEVRGERRGEERGKGKGHMSARQFSLVDRIQVVSIECDSRPKDESYDRFATAFKTMIRGLLSSVICGDYFASRS